MNPVPNDIHADGDIAIHFQPIVSLNQKTVVGLEALARPAGSNPTDYFQKARDEGRLLQADRLCRQLALAAYAPMLKAMDEQPLLFLNLEVSVIDEATVGSGALSQAVSSQGLGAQNIVIEINESRVKDKRLLRKFVDMHRDLGFTIALDDLGAGHSNLPRIADLRPHVIKLDRGLLSGIQANYIKQETLKSMVSLGHRIGALVLAEGVETQEEVDCCASLGVDLFQGFFFSRPQSPHALSLATLKPHLHETAERQRRKAISNLQERRVEGKRLHRIAEAGRSVLAQSDPIVFPAHLSRLLRGDLNIESTYLLDKDGLQATWMITSASAELHQSMLFQPTPKGADHSNKDYFYSLLDTGLDRFISETHLSMTTGKPCRTLSALVNHKSGDRYVLCLELPHEY